MLSQDQGENVENFSEPLSQCSKTELSETGIKCHYLYHIS